LPLVSVVVATKNRPDMFSRALAAILAQDYVGDVEVVVVLDGESYPGLVEGTSNGTALRIVPNRRMPGLAGGRNTGILASRGALIALCDDDDEWKSDKLRRQVDLLLSDPSVVVVGSGIEIVSDVASFERRGSHTVVTHQDLLRDRVPELHPSTLLVRFPQAAEGDRVLVDEELPGGYGEDYDWLLRLSKLGTIRSVPEPLVRVHWHIGSYYSGRWEMIAEAVGYLLEKHPDLRADRSGAARLEAKRAFALAASGSRAQGARLALTAMRHRLAERRAWVALAVAARLVSADRVQQALNRRGRGM